MIKCSANYCKSNNNFIIQGIKETNKKVKYIQAIKIVKNIINRGSRTQMSKYLQKHYNYNIFEDEEEYYLIGGEDNFWGRSIKGGKDYNPALEYYDNLLEETLGEYSFVKKLILPEAPFNYILDKEDEALKYNSVDFYIPQIDQVIEIDGKQHEKEFKNDIERDKKFKNKVIRIKTSDIKNNTLEFKNNQNLIFEKLENSKIIEKYKNSIEYKNEIKIKLIQIIRIQMTILELLKNGILDFNNEWNIEIIGVDKKESKLAIEDIQNWFKMIFDLQKIDITIPTVNLNKKELKNIQIDVDIFKKYDDYIIDNYDKIYVRNDYFENEYNYYKVETDNIVKYSLDFRDKIDIKNLERILLNIFGFDKFRDGQAKIIMNLLNGNDTIGILPTGSGKSLCYQMATFLQPGISLIVCPIKSLIKDQRDNLVDKYIDNNARIDSTIDSKEKERILEKFKNGKFQMLWLSPERFQMENFRNDLEKANNNSRIIYNVIDEVHCMSEWGHDFRTSYLLLVRTIKKYLPNSILVGLTATASQRVLKDTRIEFNIIDDNNIITPLSFIRNELRVCVYKVNEDSQSYEIEQLEKFKKLIKELQKQKNIFNIDEKNKKATIIFALLASDKRGCRKLFNEVTNMFSKYEDKIGIYVGTNKKENSEKNDKEREETQNKFKKNEIDVLIATKSFGIGLDKPNIRYIINFGIPPSFEELYQEMGRAGRDGKEAYCYIIYSPIAKKIDTEENRKKLYSTSSSIKEIKEVFNGLRNYGYGYGDVINQMVLFFSNKEDNEVNYIMYLYNRYIKENTSFEIDYQKDGELNKIQDSLYKLTLIGIVSDWTIDYRLRKIKGESRILEDIQIEEYIERYINKYENDFHFNDLDLIKYKSVKEVLDNKYEDSVEKYLNVIITWYDENITYNRRRSIEEIDNFITSLETNKDITKEFNKKISNYFGTETYDKIIDYIENNKQNYGDILDLLEIEKKHSYLDKLYTSIIRILKENRYDIKLNLIKGILDIYLNKDNQLHEDDFNYSLSEIKKLEKNNRLDVYEKILKVSKDMNIKQLKILNEKLSNYFNDTEELILNYKYFKNEKVLNKIIQIEKSKINKIEERVFNGHRKNE